jgi:hypothetical protein
VWNFRERCSHIRVYAVTPTTKFLMNLKEIIMKLSKSNINPPQATNASIFASHL